MKDAISDPKTGIPPRLVQPHRRPAGPRDQGFVRIGGRTIEARFLRSARPTLDRESLRIVSKSGSFTKTALTNRAGASAQRRSIQVEFQALAHYISEQLGGGDAGRGFRGRASSSSVASSAGSSGVPFPTEISAPARQAPEEEQASGLRQVSQWPWEENHPKSRSDRECQVGDARGDRETCSSSADSTKISI